MTRFDFRFVSGGVQLRLVEDIGLLREAVQVVPWDQWVQHAPEISRAAVARLASLAQDEVIQTEVDHALLTHGVVASLSEIQATSLGFPVSPPYDLQLDHEGTFDRAEFRFNLSWRKQFNAIAVQRKGCWLTVGDRTYRLNEPLYQLCEAVDAFNGAPPDQMESRFLHWARIQPFLENAPESRTRTSQYLRTTRIAHATRFSLQIVPGDNGPELSPVLYGSAGSDEEEAMSEWQALLPPLYQRCFAGERFPAQAECRSRYALGEGWYLVVDDALRAALSELRRVQCADAATRWSFARNPLAALREKLGDSISADDLNRLFVVTDEYSRRITGEGIWQKPVVPWAKLEGNDWLPGEIPEKLGIKIGDSTLSLDPVEVSQLLALVKDANAKGEEQIHFKGETIPVNHQTIKALEDLTGFIKPQHTRPQSDTESDKARDRNVLLIENNLDEVGFCHLLSNRGSRPTPPIPEALQTVLKPHQTDGLVWLQCAWRFGLPGVLLGDDMGLGKTLQALAFLAWVRRAQLQPRPALIIAPTGLLPNWEQEAEKHLRRGALGEVFRGYGRSTISSDVLRTKDWVLTTYETVRDRESLFAPLKFGVVVFDEMQKIKAPDSLITMCAKALNADFVVGMTGTPVENRLADLWCLVDRVWPGYLGELKSFSLQYEKNGNTSGGKELKTRLMEGKTTLPPLLLRRMKHDHLEGLPKRETIQHRVIMPPRQAARYMEIVEKARESDGRGAMLEALQQLRGLSLHPVHPEQAGSISDETYISQSARLSATFEVLDKVHAKKEKALIFLEHLAMQDYLAALIQRRYRLTTLPLLINGDVTGKERQRRVNEFQTSPRQFETMILSPRAGGVGLTLTAANHVIHLSRWWNPAVEDQCSDRVYRIGQRQAVCIHFPIAIHPQLGESSFDVKLDCLLERKRQLSRDLLAPPSVTDEDLQNLWRDTITAAPLIVSSRKILQADEISAMEPRQFERWVADTLRCAGWQIRQPPMSHDGGADVIGHRNGRWLLVQCKHTQRKGPLASDGISDLLRAKVAYSVEATTTLVLISNASEFDANTIAAADQHGINLINQEGLASWPEQLLAS